MKQNPLLITGSVLVAAWMTTGTAMGQSSGSSDTGRSSSGSAQSTKEVHPSAKGSVGASKSERADETGTPLPKGSPQTGTVDMESSGSYAAGSQRASYWCGIMSASGSGNIKIAQQVVK